MSPGRTAVILCFAFFAAAVAAGRVLAAEKESKISFWDTQRRGANCFNQALSSTWWEEAKDAEIGLVRLAPNKWKAVKRDFLMGDAGSYDALVDKDFGKLKSALDDAQANGIKVVVTTLSLPGDRWRQQNSDEPDFRLWRDKQYLRQAAALWRDLAERLAGHPAVVGYNILNEPFPEKAAGFKDVDSQDVVKWYKTVVDTPADLNRFNEAVVTAIRKVDKDTPIVIDCGLWADPRAIKYLKPLDDGKVIYAVHMYEPFDYTNSKSNDGRFVYPSEPPSNKEELATPEGRVRARLNPDALAEILDSVVQWQKEHGVPSDRIFVEEFGCDRRVAGASEYLSDLIDIFNRNKWHWAFYAFREDGWDAMDYELGTEPVDWHYLDAKDRDEVYKLYKPDNPVWSVIKKGLAQ